MARAHSIPVKKNYSPQIHCYHLLCPLIKKHFPKIDSIFIHIPMQATVKKAFGKSIIHFHTAKNVRCQKMRNNFQI